MASKILDMKARSFASLCFVLVLAAVGPPALNTRGQDLFGQLPNGSSSPPVKATLTASHQVIAPGAPFYLALDFAIQPKWHTYWINPGENGDATKLTLELPPGFQAGELLFPIPHRTVVDYGNNFKLGSYTYEEEVTHLVRVVPPADLKPGETVVIKAKATWLMCEESCIPGEAELDIGLATGGEASESLHAQRILKTVANLPSVTSWPAALSKEGDKLIVAVELGESLPKSAKLEFFPSVPSVFSVSKDMTVTREGDTVTFTGSPVDNLKELPEKISGLIVAKLDGGVEKGYFVGGKSRAAGTAAASAGAGEGEKGTAGSEAGAKSAGPFGGGFFGILLGGFLGGMILNIMPCVFPVISLKVLSFVMQAGEDKKKIFLHSAVFAGGVLVFFAILAGAMIFLRSLSGSVSWGEQMQYPIFAIFLIAVMVLIALMLFGVFEFGTGLTNVGGNLTNSAGYGGSFWNGALAVLLATPCTAPLLAPAAAVALSQPAANMALFFLIVGLGMAFPYLVLGRFPKLLDFLPKPGPWMETFKQLMGFPMLAVAVWLTGALSKQLQTSGLQWALGGVLIMAIAAWIFGRFVRPERPASSRMKGRLAALGVFVLGCFVAWNASGKVAENTAPDISQVIENHRKAGKNVFVDFTAEWCVTCKANKSIAINRKETKDAFSANNIEFVTADFTNKDPRIQEILTKHGRAGVPLYLLYPAERSQKAIALKDGIITSGDILEAIEKLP